MLSSIGRIGQEKHLMLLSLYLILFNFILANSNKNGRAEPGSWDTPQLWVGKQGTLTF